MEDFLKRTWAEINLNAIEHNYKEIRRSVDPKSKIMCVIKADAYGHGSAFLANEYEKLGADWFAVSNLEEAIQLRDSGITKPILILGYTPVCMAEKLFRYNISQALLCKEYAAKLSEYAAGAGFKINVHIKLDTGMSRIGFLCQNPDDIKNTIEDIRQIHKFNGIHIQGIFTHFAVSDEAEKGRDSTLKQFKNFTEVTETLKQEGFDIPLRHCCNSGAILDYPQMNLDIVRAGIILYGLNPSDKVKNQLNLKPAMQLKTVISQLKTVDKGICVSYGATFSTTRKTTIATVPIGYADGYLRCLSNKAKMLVCGKEAPVIGRVCMDQTILDVTDIPNVEEGSIVTVFGKDNDSEISVNYLANLSDTINYEFICLIGKRVPRIYYKNGNPVGQLNYIFNDHN